MEISNFKDARRLYSSMQDIKNQIEIWQKAYKVESMCVFVANSAEITETVCPILDFEKIKSDTIEELKKELEELEIKFKSL